MDNESVDGAAVSTGTEVVVVVVWLVSAVVVPVGGRESVDRIPEPVAWLAPQLAVMASTATRVTTRREDGGVFMS
jgi:hypothetical protein